MAFRTNKTPAIEERTVSGSSVSFNSAFALPLKACKVSFSATQAGSGDPSPSNPRAISGVSAIGLNANSTPVSVSLGDTRYGGVLDVLTGILTVTDIRLNLGQLTWQYVAGCFLARNQSLPMSSNDSASHVDLNVMFDIYKVVSSWNDITINVQDLCGGVYQDQIRLSNSNYTDAPTFKTAMQDHYVVYQLATPITIQLSANELSSIIGNNTFSTDTGTLEITFADLQEKSASGAVASFNTALAMPLASCNIAVNAWQEGSGDPSPSNVRAIHGFSEVNAYQRAVNLWDEQWVTGGLNTSGGINTFETSRRTTSFIAVVPNTTYRQVSPQNAYGGRIAYYDQNKTLLLYSGNGVSGGTKTFTTLANCRYVRITIGSGYGTTYNNDISINYPSTDTDHHAYTGNIYTIQLGQEVYGAEVDVVNGVAHCTWTAVDMANLTWYSSVVEDFVRWRCTDIKNYNSQGLYVIPTNVMVEQFKLTSYSGQAFSEGVGKFRITNGNMYACTADINTKPQGLLAYELTEPFDIQLTPTQIETLIGNNTIFADTGDVDLTYKDLDIAKRGNFREVFKLPS